MKELTYRRAIIDDTKVLLPNLTLDSRSEGKKIQIGHWGLKRLDYLGTTNLLGLYLIRGTLLSHLEEVQTQAEALEQSLLDSLLKQETLPDRQSQPLEWAQTMANLHSRVDEIVLRELIQV